MEQPDNLTKAVRRLTVAVWGIFALLLLQFAIGMWSYFRPQSFFQSGVVHDTPASPDVRFNSSTMDNDFGALPLEQKVKTATVLLITRYKKDGDQVQSVISEILKKDPNTRFYYKVGDDYAELGRFRLAGEEVHGDGQVVFFTGNPANMREAYSYSQDRIGGLGQMPISKLREMVVAQ